MNPKHGDCSGGTASVQIWTDVNSMRRDKDNWDNLNFHMRQNNLYIIYY